jgi:hypothetical protein
MPKQIATASVQGSREEEDHVKMERRGSRGLKYNGNKKQAGNSQRLLGVEEDCIGSQGPHSSA